MATPPRTGHTVGTVKFSPRNGPCTLGCSCGWTQDYATPDQLEAGWLRHRQEVRADLVTGTTRVRLEYGRAA